jgi:adenylate kinase family enzyme
VGVKNFLVEGVSGSGKTAVCDELRRRGYHAIHGDRELAYQGDPRSGAPLAGFAHEHHIWDLDKVSALLADQSQVASFFCGGSRNFERFIQRFDGVFVLEVDLDTLHRRLASRPDGEWGGQASERELITRLHATKRGVPEGAIAIDATGPVSHVVDAILSSALGIVPVSTAFQEPGELVDGDLRLAVEQLYSGDLSVGYAPAYRFAMTVQGQKVGDIELRLGTSDFIQQFAGHVGYNVEPPHRGHRFAARALRLLLPLAGRHGFDCVWATVDPANWASRRSCELAGATMVEIVELPEDCEMYREGYRHRCRYRLQC